MISVVIPVHNRRDTLPRAIRSVLEQRSAEFELIVVDDGSTDGSADAALSVGDSRVRLVRQENRGAGAARNRGIEEARHELVAFLDADDEWLPEFLETIGRLALRFPECGLYASGYMFREPDGTRRPVVARGIEPGFEGVLPDYFAAAARSDPPVWTGAACVRKTAAAEAGLFAETVASGEDLLLWARLAYGGGVAYSSRVCSVYHRNRYDTYDEPSPRVPDNPDAVGRGLADLLTMAARERPDRVASVRRYCGLWHKMRASAFIRAGRKAEARGEIAKSFRLAPRPELPVYGILSFLPVRWGGFLFGRAARLKRGWSERG